MNNIVADRQIIASYLSENDTSSAFALLNLLSSLYDLQGEDLEDYNDYKTLVNLQVSWKYEGNMMNQPDSSEISILESIASNTHSYAGNMARNILTYANVQHYCNCLPHEDSVYLKNEFIHTENIQPENNILKISAEPNPAQTYVAFDFELPGMNSTGLINIADVQGKMIRQFQVNGKTGQIVWNSSGVKAGVYYYHLGSSGLNKAGKVIIK
jgi:Secretion system C-terminal sorting domain